MKTKRAIQLCAMVFALAGLTVLGLSRPLKADERPQPHLHYVGSITHSDGSPIPGECCGMHTFGDMSALAPPGCSSTGYLLGGTWAGPRYNLVVAVKDTPECIQAMQTFQPNPAGFPSAPTKPGWTFRRR